MKNEVLEKAFHAHKNLLIEGGIASGKTTNVLFKVVDNAIEREENLFILDSKEEYINKYYKKLKEKNYNTIILNLRDMDKSEGWNPLEYPYQLYKKGDSDKAQEYLEKIGKIMFYEHSTQDPFWTATASDFFIGITLALFEDGTADEVNLHSVHNMLNGIDRMFEATDYITKYFQSKGVFSKPYMFASTTFLAPRSTQGSILSVARQKLRVYISREKLAHLMNKTTFYLEDITNKPVAIIVIARDENKSLNTLAAMFIEQVYAILVDKKAKNKFNFILDNFDSIDKCNDLVDILGSCISRNIKICIATRSVSELANIYGSYMLKLCDLLSVGNSDIRLVIGNTEETVEKAFETITITEEKVNYPTLKIEDIKIFDLRQFVKDREAKALENKDISTFDSEKSFNTDNLIKRIDQRLAELEEKEKMEQPKQQAYYEEKPELEQFKIED